MGNFQEDTDLQNTVGISARRFEESPFLSRYDGPDLVRGVYAGRFFAVYNGEDAIERYWTLRRKALLFDVPEKPIEISGPDAIAFLDKVLTRKVSAMKIGRGYYALACTPQGGIFMDGVLFRLGKTRFWYVQADGAFEAWLAAHSGGFDVTISDPQSRVLQLQGPASIAIMSDATNGAVNEDMRYFTAGHFDIGGQQLYVSRTGFTNELGFEIYCDGAATDHLALWDHLIAAGTPHGMQVSSTRALTMRRVEAGILGNLTDMDTDMTPYAAGLGDFVNLDKGDFIGRDALANADKGRLLMGLTCATTTPGAGNIVRDGNKAVARIRMGVTSPTLGLGIGYVHFDTPGNWIGRELSLEDAGGSHHAVNIVDVPFFDPERKIVRGIDRTIPSGPVT